MRAAAAGLDIGSVLSDISAPMPDYRFPVMLRQAQDACAAVNGLGQSILFALEKRDAEAFAALRSTHEMVAMDVLREVRVSQVEESQASLEASQRSRDVVELRRKYNQKLVDDGLNIGEITALVLQGVSLGLEAAVAIGYIVSGGLKLIPSFLAGAAGFGGSPTVNASMGGQQIGNSAEMAVATLRSIATAADKGASMATVLAGHARRADEWRHQVDLAASELTGVDKQILAAGDPAPYRRAGPAPPRHLRGAGTPSRTSSSRTKFTNTELYDWMIAQLSAVYFQSYQPPRTWRSAPSGASGFELGLTESSYIGYGYWDSLRKGLMAGERLGHDLRSPPTRRTTTSTGESTN